MSCVRCNGKGFTLKRGDVFHTDKEGNEQIIIVQEKEKCYTCYGTGLGLASTGYINFYFGG